MSNWESALWQSQAQKYSCTGLSHSTKIGISVWILHFASNRFLHEQISSCECSLFSRNIYLCGMLGYAMYTTWSKPIDPMCPICVVSLIPPCFCCTDSYQLFFSLFHWLLCWPNRSWNIRCHTHKMVDWAFRSRAAIAMIYVRFIICVTVIFALIWIIQIAVPVKSISSAENAFGCAILITVRSMTVNSSDSVDV
jgi:hypothetical protein